MIGKIVINQLVCRAVDKRIHIRHFQQNLRTRLGKQGHKAQFNPVFFNKTVLIFLSERHHRRHIHFVESRQHGSCIFCRNQTFCNRLTHPRHFHTTFWTAKWFRSRWYWGGYDGWLRFRFRCSRCSYWRNYWCDGNRLCRFCIGCFLRVCLCDTSVNARSCDFRSSKSRFCQHFSSSRRRVSRCVTCARRGRYWGGRFGGFGVNFWRDGGCRTSCTSGVGVNCSDDIADFKVRAFGRDVFDDTRDFGG